MKHIIIGTLWPSFWMATILSGLIFSSLDPVELANLLGFAELTALGVYTLGFLFFWVVCAWSGFFSILFSKKPR